MIAAGAVAALVAVGKGRTAFEARAGQIVEQDLEGGAEEIFPTRRQEGEPLALGRQHPVSRQRYGLSLATRAKASPSQSPRAVPRNQSRCRRPSLPGWRRRWTVSTGRRVIPGGAFAAGRQARPPARAQLQQVPELEGQPAGAPLARAVEAERTQARRHAGVGGVRGARAGGGKEGAGWGAWGERIEGGEGAGPGRPLGVVALAQRESSGRSRTRPSATRRFSMSDQQRCSLPSWRRVWPLRYIRR